ncbi:MAG: hypothetical protein Q9192_000757 [Flavoplaca navasiana]
MTLRILAEGNRFIPDLIRQTYHGWSRGQLLDVLVAVVDRIAPPTSRIKNVDTVPLASGEVNYSGKGLSVLLTDSETATPGLWSQSESRQGDATSTLRRRSTLSFQFGPNKESLHPAEANAAPKSFQSKTIKLPVANTVFHNGRESSIQAQRWIVGETMLEPTLACIKRSWIHEQVLRIAFPYPPEPDKFPLQIIAPMKCIGPRQRVATSMGNIIRQVHSLEDLSGPAPHRFQSEAEPASKQLEDAINQWVTEPGNEMGAVEVWALVRPPTILQRHREKFFTKIVKAGGHFHKVLSGGGGWGNRQGLLALDPEVDFDVTPELTMAQDFNSVVPEEGTAPSQIVNPGDFVEFFVRRPIKASSTERPKVANSLFFKCPPCVVFGTTPSTVDAMPEPDGMTHPNGSSSDCIFIPCHFGMLSEQGASLKTTSIDGEVTRTKIDIPHALVSCGTQGHPVKTSSLLKDQSTKSRESQDPQHLEKGGLIRRIYIYNAKVDNVATQPGSESSTSGHPFGVNRKSKKLQYVKRKGLTKRLKLDNSKVDNAASEPRTEYSAPSPTEEMEDLTLAAALARIRKAGLIAVPKRRTILLKDAAQTGNLQNSGTV